MAQTAAVQAVQAIYKHVDEHVRELLPPPPGPEVETASMILQGSLSAFATGPSTGSGPCPPIVKTDWVKSANYYGGQVLAGRVAAPHSWTNAVVTKYRNTDGQGGEAYVSFTFQDASFADIRFTPTAFNTPYTEGTSSVVSDYPGMTVGEKAAVRYIAVWVRSNGLPPFDPSVLYPFSVGVSATFTGTCEDIEIPPSPPVVGVISTGVAGAWSFDYKARITGWYLQEFDGTSGSITLGLAKATRGPSPTFVNIAGSVPPAISTGRYGEDATLAGWDDTIDRGDVIRVSVTTITSFTRVLFGLRIRRLEP